MGIRVINAATGYPVFLEGRQIADFGDNYEAAAAFIKVRAKERPEMKLKIKGQYTPEENAVWQRREAARMADGTYKVIQAPWAGSAWWDFALGNTAPHLGDERYRDAITGESKWRRGPDLIRRYHGQNYAALWEVAKHHYVHVATKDSELLAYTESDEKGAADRQTVVTAGKYLTKYFSKVLRPDQIEDYAGRWNVELKPVEVDFVTDPKEIARLYELGGFGSCMAISRDRFPYRGKLKGHHPVEIYGAPGSTALAVIRKGKGISARSVVNMETKQYNRLYGDSRLLERGLREHGFQQHLGLPGAKLNMILLDGVNPEPGRWVLGPYVDNCPHHTVVDGFFVNRKPRSGELYAQSAGTAGATQLLRC